jgi:hypothetical protein
MASTKITYTTATLAEEIGAESAKALRVFLRSKASGITPVGKGARYSLEFGARDLAGLKKRYAEWGAAQAERKAEAAQAATQAAPASSEAAPAAKPQPKASRSRKAAKVDLNKIVEAELAESGADSIGELADESEPSEDDLELIEDELDDLDIEEL